MAATNEDSDLMKITPLGSGQEVGWELIGCCDWNYAGFFLLINIINLRLVGLAT